MSAGMVNTPATSLSRMGVDKGKFWQPLLTACIVKNSLKLSEEDTQDAGSVGTTGEYLVTVMITGSWHHLSLHYKISSKLVKSMQLPIILNS